MGKSVSNGECVEERIWMICQAWVKPSAEAQTLYRMKDSLGLQDMCIYSSSSPINYLLWHLLKGLLWHMNHTAYRAVPSQTKLSDLNTYSPLLAMHPDA